MGEDYVLVKITDLPAAASLEGLVLYGVEVSGDSSVKVPAELFQVLVAAAMAKAESALEILPSKVEMIQVGETEYPDLTI